MGGSAKRRLCVSFTTGDGEFTRAGFLRGMALAGGAALLGGIPSLISVSSAAPPRSPRLDARILNLALLLEYLESAFYEESLSTASLTGELQRFAREVGRHERAHVRLLEEALGPSARSRPSFDFGDGTSNPESFSSTALLIEETGMAAYIGQGANLTPEAAVTAGRIVSVEARHTAWIRNIMGRHPAPHAADPAMSKEEVLAVLDDEGFLS